MKYFTTDAMLNDRIVAADGRYGDFASTHEALGVMCEEWGELQEAIRSNNFDAIHRECLDLAAACVRLAEQSMTNQALRKRSVKGG